MPADQIHFGFYASLDFPGRSTLMLWEIAERLGQSVQHLLNEVDRGHLIGIDLRNPDVSRRCIRIPIESYHNFVLQRLTGPADFKMKFLRDLPATTRCQLMIELFESLAAGDRRQVLGKLKEKLKSAA